MNGKITDTTIRDAADLLHAAARTRRPTGPIRGLIGADNIDAAYAVQHELVNRRIDDGGVVVGRKIGLTSTAVQRQLGVDQPDFGFLLDDMDVSNESVVPSRRLLQPKVEAEIAFVLSTDLVGEITDVEQVRGAVDYAVAALEIVDSRIVDWDLTIADTVADNASSGLFVLGQHRVRLDQFEPQNATMHMYVDEKLVSSGDGAACLGDPLAALMWLACAAARYGAPLRAGQIVLSGALGPMVAVPPGARIWAEIAPIGTVHADFSTWEHP